MMPTAKNSFMNSDLTICYTLMKLGNHTLSQMLGYRDLFVIKTTLLFLLRTCTSRFMISYQYFMCVLNDSQIIVE